MHNNRYKRGRRETIRGRKERKRRNIFSFKRLLVDESQSRESGDVLLLTCHSRLEKKKRTKND